MNNTNTYLVLIKRTVCFFLLFLSACQSLQSPTSTQTGIPTVSPSLTTFVFGATKVSGEGTNDQPVTNLTPLPKFDDYIIYSKYKSSTEFEIWAINPNNLVPLFITSDFTPRSWSPSNKFWLLTGHQSINIANSDGSGFHSAFTYKEYQGVDPFWLTDDVVIFNAYRDYLSLPDMYTLDVNTGAVAQLFAGSNKFIQAAFPSEKKWLVASWPPPSSIDIVDENGKTERFFDEYLINTDPFAPYQKIQHINRLKKYLFIAKGPGDINYKLWLASKQEPPQVLFDPESDGIDQFTVSPDERYVALTYNSVRLKGLYVYIFSLDNLQLLYNWVYPYKLGSGYFIWSPDSQSIVLHYSESNAGNSTNVNFGIQIMDITTGETRIILNEDVTQILDWHFIE